MKQLFLALLIFIGYTSYAQEASEFTVNGETLISTNSEVWDFGKISEKNGIVEHGFIIKNISNKPFIIDNITANCGCTLPTYDKKPLMPNDSTTIKVRYNPYNRPGYFSKRIYIWSNNNGVSNVLLIKGYVAK